MATITDLHESIPPQVKSEAPLVRAHTLNSLLRGAGGTYIRNFKPIFLCYLLPTLPFMTLQMLVQTYSPSPALIALTFLATTVVSFFATGAITFALSDICLGNKPNLRASYARLFRNKLWLTLLGTSLLATLLMFIGFVLLLVPGLIATVLLVFTSQVVVLERVGGIRALKRSTNLVKGSFWRTAGTLLMLMVIVYGFVLVALIPLTLAFALLMESGIGAIIGGVLMGLVYPFLFCAVILMYYDRRVRKESYGVAQLEEDLMR